MTEGLEQTRFRPLPHPHTTQGAERRVGVEIEFSGLTEAATADLVRRHLGGRTVQAGAHEMAVDGTSLGRIGIVLDTALRRYEGNAVIDAGLANLRGLVPVEIVTEPLGMDGLRQLDAFRDILRDAGAMGTDDRAVAGFGLHFNIETVAPAAAQTRATILAFGLLEDWLRRMQPMDVMRRVLPFVDPWPRAFTQALAEAGAGAGLAELRRLYARHCNSRNYALDLLPIFRCIDETTFAELFPRQTNTKGRPAFHYRLPDCRIDDTRWTLALEWERWRMVEVLADSPDLLSELAADFAARAPRILDDRRAWAAHVSAVLGPAGERLRG